MNQSPSHGPDAYELVAPRQVVFGVGRIADLGRIVAGLGTVAGLVAGSRGLAALGGRAAVESLLSGAGVGLAWTTPCAREPTVADVVAAVRGLPAPLPDAAVVVAIGGGSTIDLAKAVSALATDVPRPADVDEDAVIDLLEGVGSGRPISRRPLPVVAVPTTAGTGAEATRNAVISCPRRRFKKSMRSPLLVPAAAVVDPALAGSCPPEVTAAAGLDAITQLVESFVCRFRSPVPRALVLDALPRAVAALPRALARPGDLDARAALGHAALLSGIALTNSGLGLAHGVAAALGIECGTPHGVACGLMLPVAVAVNRAACRDDFAILERAIDPAADPDADRAADAFVRRIDALCGTAGTPRRLAEVGLERERLPWLAENSGGGSMRGNPVSVDPPTLLRILERAW